MKGRFVGVVGCWMGWLPVVTVAMIWPRCYGEQGATIRRPEAEKAGSCRLEKLVQIIERGGENADRAAAEIATIGKVPVEHVARIVKKLPKLWIDVGNVQIYARAIVPAGEGALGILRRGVAGDHGGTIRVCILALDYSGQLRSYARALRPLPSGGDVPIYYEMAARYLLAEADGSTERTARMTLKDSEAFLIYCNWWVLGDGSWVPDMMAREAIECFLGRRPGIEPELAALMLGILGERASPALPGIEKQFWELIREISPNNIIFALSLSRIKPAKRMEILRWYLGVEDCTRALAKNYEGARARAAARELVDEKTVEALCTILKENNDVLVRNALRLVYLLGPRVHAVVPSVLHVLRGAQDDELRRLCGLALRAVGCEADRPFIEEALRREKDATRKRLLQEALRSIDNVEHLVQIYDAIIPRSR